MSLVELTKVLDDTALGDTIEILADDRRFPSEITSFCVDTGNTLVSLLPLTRGCVAEVRKGVPGQSAGGFG